MVLGKSHFVYHLKLSPVPSTFWHVMLVSQISETRKNHREIERAVEDVCCQVSLIPTSTLESRDEILVRGVEL